MAKFTIQITTDNDAFQERFLVIELSRILKVISKEIVDGRDFGYHQNARDINGNVVGTYALKEDDGSPGIIN